MADDQMQTMMSDAIKRARQMYRRSSQFTENSFNEEKKETEKKNPQKEEKSERETDAFSIYRFARMLGIDDDRLILFIIAIILAQEKDSMLTVLALLYIAM